METVLVVVAILALIGGAAAILSRQGGWPRPLTALRAGSGETEPEGQPESGSDPILALREEPAPLASVIPTPLSTVRSLTASPGAPSEPVRLDLLPAASDVSAAARFERLEGRLDELQRVAASQSDDLAEAAHRIHTDLVLWAEAEEARREAAQERLRADLLAIVSRLTFERQLAATPRRMETSAELYAHLARFEAALATVTNPILLPGEPYTPPAELPPESLIWENWNEVGERAFALAETYSAQRVHLSAQSRADVGAFVTTLRTLLTRSVYPNVQREADMAHQSALHGALAEIAAELPRIRDLLETEYLEGRSV